MLRGPAFSCTGLSGSRGGSPWTHPELPASQAHKELHQQASAMGFAHSEVWGDTRVQLGTFVGGCGQGEERVGPSLQGMATLCCSPLVLSVDALGYVTFRGQGPAVSRSLGPGYDPPSPAPTHWHTPSL